MYGTINKKPENIVVVRVNVHKDAKKTNRIKLAICRDNKSIIL